MDGARAIDFPNVLDRIGAMAPLIDRRRSEFETLRRLPPAVTEAMGGAEISPQDLVEVVEAASELDGSFGWCLTNATTMGRMVAYLPPEFAANWVAGPDCQFAGSTATLGQARRVAGGFKVTGRWPFTSGILSARRFIGLCLIEGEGDPETPELIFCHIPVKQMQIHETWFVSGLKGTGGHHVEVQDVFVPSAHCHGFVDATALHSGPLFRFRMIPMLTLSVSIVPLGKAKAAVAAFIALSGRTTAGTSQPLRDREMIQTDLARAEALRRSGKALILSALEDLEEALSIGGQSLFEARAFFRVALAHSAEACLRAVEVLAAAAGVVAIQENGRLERCQRDVQAAVKHVAMSPHKFTVGGQVMLGLGMGAKRF